MSVRDRCSVEPAARHAYRPERTRQSGYTFRFECGMQGDKQILGGFHPYRK